MPEENKEFDYGQPVDVVEEYKESKAHIVGTPGSGFGKNGEGFFRLTAFGKRENTIEAMKRMKS